MKKKENIFEKNKIILIIWLIVFTPIAYYFFYALPKHNTSILEYQKEKDRIENERIENEKYEKENSYSSCLEQAEEQKSLDRENYCNAWYKECTIIIDEYNKEYWNTYEYDWTSRRKSYAECEKFAYKNWWCMIKTEYWNKIDKSFEDAKETCLKIYNN